jgi:hypothetical protein
MPAADIYQRILTAVIKHQRQTTYFDVLLVNSIGLCRIWVDLSGPGILLKCGVYTL